MALRPSVKMRRGAEFGDVLRKQEHYMTMGTPVTLEIPACMKIFKFESDVRCCSSLGLEFPV